MADTILIELFKEVGSIVFQVAKQEIKSLVGVDEEVQKLQDRLGFIKAMLDDAEERHAMKQRTEKLWLEQLQNLYYEMDDIVDTWNTARIRAEIEKEEGNQLLLTLRLLSRRRYAPSSHLHHVVLTFLCVMMLVT